MKRARLAGLASLAIVLPGFGFGGTAFGQTAFPDASFSGYSSGTAVHVNAVQLGAAGPRIADAEIAFAGASVNSKGFPAAILNEFEQAVVTASAAAKKAMGRGQGIEVGLATNQPNDPNVNQLQLAGLAEAVAPPSSALVRKEGGPIKASPLAFASLVRGEAQPIYSNNVCVLGQPISYGLGYAADAQLVNAGGDASDGGFASPVVAADQGTPTEEAASQSKSFTYLKPNGDGTFALVTETRMKIAPVSLFKGSLNEIKVSVLGEWVLRATATGKAGGAKLDYAPDGVTSPDTAVLEITLPGGAPIRLTFQDVFGDQGFTLPVNPVVNLAIGEDVRAIPAQGQTADPASQPLLAADGTEAAGAVDIVRLNLLNLGLPVDSPQVADLRIGHMESRAKVPAGGIKCPIPVKKATNADPVTAGENFIWTITIPSSADVMDGLACDLVGISAVDNATADSGVRFRMSNASNGGTVSADGKKVTWSNLGNYTPGKPPIVVTVTGTVEGESGGGVITNTADVTANLGNCTGGTASQQLTGLAQLINNAGVSGGVRVLGPRANVLAAAASQEEAVTTPRTGDNSLVRSLAGFGLVGLALFGRRFIRRITG